MNEQLFNYIQIITGLISAAFIFIGLFIPVRKLNKDDRTAAVPNETIIRSIVFLFAGLMLFAIARTCTNLTTQKSYEYDIITVYLASLIEVIKQFGFIVLIPVLFKLFKHSPRKEKDISD